LAGEVILSGSSPSGSTHSIELAATSIPKSWLSHNLTSSATKRNATNSAPGKSPTSVIAWRKTRKKIVGDEGFEKRVDQVATIEKQLGIYELTQFTPKS
jgi:hypothetical protein